MDMVMRTRKMHSGTDARLTEGVNGAGIALAEIKPTADLFGSDAPVHTTRTTGTPAPTTSRATEAGSVSLQGSGVSLRLQAISTVGARSGASFSSTRARGRLNCASCARRERTSTAWWSTGSGCPIRTTRWCLPTRSAVRTAWRSFPLARVHRRLKGARDEPDDEWIGAELGKQNDCKSQSDDCSIARLGTERLGSLVVRETSGRPEDHGPARYVEASDG